MLMKYNMKKEKCVHCNLCQKNFSDNDFIDHILTNHLPVSIFVCKICGIEFTSAENLQEHVAVNHILVGQKLESPNACIRNTFVNSNDVIKHAKQSFGWIRYAFSYNFETVLSKKQLRSHISSNFSEKTRNYEETKLICKFCDNKPSKIYCCYCADNFQNTCHLKSHLLNVHLILPNFLKKFVNFCDICKSVFSSEKHLIQHKNNKHKTETNAKKTTPFCHFCGKSLANKSNLKRHVLNQHSEEAGATPSNCIFTCDYCKCFFSNKSSVKRHIENLHLKEKDTRKSISCFQCEQRFNSIKNLNAHLTIEHKIQINETKLNFSNLTEFWEWKKDEEIRTNSRFIQLRGLRRQKRKGEEISTLKFVCNRSGIFHSKSNGKRAYRIKGSSKIGRYCSAYIEISFKENSIVDGTYCSTHSGHDNDLRYLTLTMDEKREIYEKIKSGATFSAILNEIRNSVGKEIKRKHLVTNKDLHNIVTTFKKLSKPSFEAVFEREQLTDNNSDYRMESENDKVDRAFHNDLDICSDLWVETCQRMINRFDQTQSKTSTNDIIKSNLETKSVVCPKNMFIDETCTQYNSNRSKNRISMPPDSHQNGLSFGINSQDYTPNGLPSGNINSTWYKQNFSTLNGTVSESQLNPVDMSYFNNVSRNVANNVRKEIDFCGVQDASNDLRLGKDFYNSSAISSNENASRLIANDAKISEIFSTTYNTLTTSNIENNNSSVYMKNIGMYDKTTNSNTESHSDMFDTTFMLPTIEKEVSEESLHSPELLNEDICDMIGSDDETNLNSISVTKQKNESNEVSNLRDRVNSVTALYNIVESELDERKKNIIRNYVDNMFRVLQYRYNKCKTKKKQNSSKRIQKSPEEKNKNRRRKINTDKSSKLKMTERQNGKQQKSIHEYSCSTAEQYVSKNSNAYQNTLNNTIITTIRSDINLMRWDQY